jgi:hypothetical protein
MGIRIRILYVVYVPSLFNHPSLSDPKPSVPKRSIPHPTHTPPRPLIHITPPWTPRLGLAHAPPTHAPHSLRAAPRLVDHVLNRPGLRAAVR